MNPWFLCLPPLPRFFRLVLVLANYKFIGCSILGVNDSGIICWFVTFTDVFTCILTIRSTVSILACAPIETENIPTHIVWVLSHSSLHSLLFSLELSLYLLPWCLQQLSLLAGFYQILPN